MDPASLAAKLFRQGGCDGSGDIDTDIDTDTDIDWGLGLAECSSR